MIKTRPLTPSPIWLGRIEAGNHARSVFFAQAGRERTLTRFVPSSIPDPDDEIVEYGGIEAWAEEADDSDEELVPEPMPDDPEEVEEIASLAEYVFGQSWAEEIAWADDVGAEHDLDFEAWVDEPDENGEFSRPRPRAKKEEHGYVDKHAGRKAVRKSWARHPHRLPILGMTEKDISILETLHERLVLAVVEGILEILDERAAA